MLFFKPRQKPAEIIPPPQDFEEELREKPKFFDELIKKPKSETFTEEDEFNRLVKELSEGPKPLSEKAKAIPEKKGSAKSDRIKAIVKPKSKSLQSKQKLLKKEIKKSKKATKRLQPKKPVKIKQIKQAKKQRAGIAEDGLDLEDLDFGMPKELQETKLPETLEDFENEREFGQKKPKEVLDAEEEIQNAIEKIKKREKPSILKGLFFKKPKEAPEEHIMPELPAADDISGIKNKINDARQALMRFDLEAAKRSYIEAMRIYNSMASEEKAKVYHDIKELYSERKSAEELKV